MRDGVDAAPLIRVRGATKTYAAPSGAVTALTDVGLDIAAGEFVAIVGRSGSGKTTLLNLLAGIDRPTAGEVRIGRRSISELAEADLAAWRGRNIGLVFQFFQLLPTLTVVENVMLPMDFCATYPVRERRPRAIALLEQVGIADQAGKLPALLSGGQQQRAAIARALANEPPILLADEPTGNLDAHTGDTMLGLFSSLAEDGKAVVMVTHERDVTRFASRQVTLADGRVDGDRSLAGALR